MNQNQEILTVGEVCDILGIGRNTCGKLLQEKKLKGFKIGARIWKIPREAVNEFIRSESEL